MRDSERFDRRAVNRKIFCETSEYIASSSLLWESVRLSLAGSEIILHDDEIKAGDDISEGASIVLSKEKTINAALKYKGEKVAIHNFASATNPGGGVRRGSGAQEESICRATTLYSVLDNYSLSKYYSIHHEALDVADSFLYTSAMIYTPDVVIVRPDDGGAFLDEYQKCDVVTIAAPHLSENPEGYIRKNYVRLRDIFVDRFNRLFASASRAGCTVVVTGAFGCGAFHNDPYMVADALKESIARYSHKFKTIELAVFCSDYEDRNYQAFAETFGVF